MKRLILLAAALPAACAAPTQQLSAENYAHSVTLTVQGMSCPNCANNITHALMALPGVADVQIDMGAGQVRVVSDSGLPPQFELEQAVRDAGFTPGATKL